MWGLPIFSRSCLPLLAGPYYGGLVVSSPACRSAFPQRACGFLPWGLQHRSTAPLLSLSPKWSPIYLHPSGDCRIPRYERCYDGDSHTKRFCECGPTPFFLSSSRDVLRGWQSSAFLVGEKERTLCRCPSKKRYGCFPWSIS